MTRVVSEPMPRYVAQIGEAVRHALGTTSAATWAFRSAHDSMAEAEAEARRLAEDNEFVRVIDRGEALP